MTDVMGEREELKETSGWAIGGVVFAGTIMIMLGVFEFFQGLAAIINDDFYVLLPNYAFNVDTTVWGWIHLILGIIVVVAGFYLFARSRVAGAIAVILAVVTAVANFFFIPYYPFWSLLIIALAIYVIWAVGREIFES
jgi:hypothetical protein